MFKRFSMLAAAVLMTVAFAGQCVAAGSLISVVSNGANTYDIVINQESEPATMLNIALSCTPTDDPVITMPSGWGVVAGVNFVKQNDAIILVIGNVELGGLKIPAGVLAKVYASNVPIISYTYDKAPTSMQFAASGSLRLECVLGITPLPKDEIKIAPGAMYQLEATVLPAAASNKGVTWSSGNTSAATVSTGGLVTAHGNGTTVITASTDDGGFSTSCVITVEPDVIPVTGITLNKTAAELTVGQSIELVATITPENATNRGVTWATGNPDVAKIKDGLVEALSAGECEITAMADDGVHKAVCKVVVKEGAPDPEKPPVEPAPEDNGGGGCNTGMTWPLLMALVPVCFMLRKGE